MILSTLLKKIYFGYTICKKTYNTFGNPRKITISRIIKRKIDI